MFFPNIKKIQNDLEFFNWNMFVNSGFRNDICLKRQSVFYDEKFKNTKNIPISSGNVLTMDELVGKRDCLMISWDLIFELGERNDLKTKFWKRMDDDQIVLKTNKKFEALFTKDLTVLAWAYNPHLMLKKMKSSGHFLIK